MSELTQAEREALARAIALDKWLITENYGDDWGDIFNAGWDAAMNYIKERDDKTVHGSGEQK
jgi:hypothetical protein